MFSEVASITSYHSGKNSIKILNDWLTLWSFVHCTGMYLLSKSRESFSFDPSSVTVTPSSIEIKRCNKVKSSQLAQREALPSLSAHLHHKPNPCELGQENTFISQGKILQHVRKRRNFMLTFPRLIINQCIENWPLSKIVFTRKFGKFHLFYVIINYIWSYFGWLFITFVFSFCKNISISLFTRSIIQWNSFNKTLLLVCTWYLVLLLNFLSSYERI